MVAWKLIQQQIISPPLSGAHFLVWEPVCHFPSHFICHLLTHLLAAIAKT